MRRTSGFRIVMLGSKSMARGIKHVSRIWRATRLLRWSMALMIYPCGSSCGLAKRSIWPETSPISPHQPSSAKNVRILVSMLNPFVDCGFEFRDVVENTSPYTLSGDFSEAPLDEIEPGAGRRSEVQDKALCLASQRFTAGVL